jgi:hypothetical protein
MPWIDEFSAWMMEQKSEHTVLWALRHGWPGDWMAVHGIFADIHAVPYHCLKCEAGFRNLWDVWNHITKEEHYRTVLEWMGGDEKDLFNPERWATWNWQVCGAKNPPPTASFL